MHRVRTPFFVDQGRRRYVRGQVVADDDPAVKAHPQRFEKVAADKPKAPKAEAKHEE